MKLNRIKLNALSESSLQDKEMNAIVGGSEICTCSCDYAERGGSSNCDNMVANGQNRYHSTTGCNQMIYNPETGSYWDVSLLTA